MIRLEHAGTRLCDGVSRRELLRIGGLAPLGLSLPAFLQSTARAERGGPRSFGQAKRCIQLFLWGGPGAQETWDLKPEAPLATRGDFKPIRTSVEGFEICEHMPLLARLAHRYAIIRSQTHTGVNHGTGAYHMLTGHIHYDPGTLRRPARKDMPNWAINAARFLPHPAGLPNCVHIPDPIWDGGVTEVPGQRPGILGSRTEPFRITGDLTRPDFRPDTLRLAPGVDGGRLRRRTSLLHSVEERAGFLSDSEAGQDHGVYYEKALNLVSSAEAYRAFDLASESKAARERYGLHWFGQSLILARRLVEAGVPVVTVFWNTPSLTVDDSWDTHNQQHRRLKDTILPPFDRGLSALLDDLQERGMLDSTLVTWWGEFGRTPKINSGGGRDHWGFCQSVGLAGGGVRGGVVHGASTEDGGYPRTDPVTPDDLTATMFHLLGIRHKQEMYDHEQRPILLSNGEVVEAIL
ncbi:MAG: DUF1501 domain-containing protein [Armatimonadetes bacterium]|nr:DUF1501 domain-containing protein [Armatimonadota bacterium]